MQPDHIAGSERIAGPMGPQPPGTAHQSPGIRHRAAMGPQARREQLGKGGPDGQTTGPGGGARAEGPNRQYRSHYRPNKAPSSPRTAAEKGRATKPEGGEQIGPQGHAYSATGSAGTGRKRRRSRERKAGGRSMAADAAPGTKQEGTGQAWAGAGGAEAKPERSPESDLHQLMICCWSDPASADRHPSPIG